MGWTKGGLKLSLLMSGERERERSHKPYREAFADTRKIPIINNVVDYNCIIWYDGVFKFTEYTEGENCLVHSLVDDVRHTLFQRLHCIRLTFFSVLLRGGGINYACTNIKNRVMSNTYQNSLNDGLFTVNCHVVSPRQVVIFARFEEMINFEGL